jgi:plasmid segregation protein ParM
MGPIVRSIDVGYGFTKYIVGETPSGPRCASFPSIACLSTSDPSKAQRAGRLNTWAVPIGGVFYEVGPDVHLAADAFRATQLHEHYVQTPEYLALARGAMRAMKVDAIDLLVVGLPVAMYATAKTALEKLMTGTHDVGGGISVTVRQARAMAQPHGALIDFATRHDAVVRMEHEYSLVIDPGSRTFDWLLAHGMKLSHKRSHSVDRGIWDVLNLIADDISAEIGVPYTNLDAIDQALRRRKSLTIYQKPYRLSRMSPIVEGVARQAVAAMMRRVGATYDVQNVILVGGAAFLFRKAVREAFKAHVVVDVEEPFFANVRGYQIAGRNLLLARRDGGLPDDVAKVAP